MIGENFPYTNFHDMNLDWMIKIAKDFLDQYTNIQETITEGLGDITNTKDDAVGELEQLQTEITAALNGWYDEHSADIATELADALADLNEWFTAHSGYLNTELETNLAAFSERADAKAAEALESIPDDYTALSNTVNTQREALKSYTSQHEPVFLPGNLYDPNNLIVGEYMVPETGLTIAQTDDDITGYIYVGDILNGELGLFNVSGNSLTPKSIHSVTQFDKNYELITGNVRNVSTFTPTGNCAYVRLSINRTAFTGTIAIFKKGTSAGAAYPTQGITKPFAINGTIINNVKYLIPLDPDKQEITTDGTTISAIVKGRFITSDNELTPALDLTYTESDISSTLIGIAYDPVSGQLIHKNPTAYYKSENYYYIGMWYARKMIFDPFGIQLRSSNKDDGVVNGKLFIWVDSTGINILGTNNIRFMYKGVSQASFMSSVNPTPLHINTATEYIKYIWYNGSINASIAMPSDALVLGYVYQWEFHSLSNNIISNKLPILTLTQRDNTATYINYRRLGYNVVPNYQSNNDSRFAYFGTTMRVSNAWDYTNFPYVWDKENDNISLIPCTKTHNTTSLSGKKILTVGDSITYRGYFQKFIATASSAEFVGTVEAVEPGIYCEGYSGRSAPYVLGADGPFYNPNTQQIDFHYYATLHQIEPDYITILFGLNDTETPAEYASIIQNFINSVHTHNAAIKVFVITPFDEAHAPWYGAGVMYFARFQRIRLYQCFCNGLSNCTIIPGHYVIDDDTDYAKHSVEYGVGNLTFDIINDGVHPDRNTGFKKLANIVYNYIQ